MLTNPRFEASYGRMFGPDIGASESSDLFFKTFYNKFLRHPEVAKLFSGTDMQRQIGMLKKSLFHLVAFYVTGEPSAELEKMAEIHCRVGVDQSMFDDWLEALLDTVQEFDIDADEATKLAWAWALSPGVTYMRLALPGQLSVL